MAHYHKCIINAVKGQTPPAEAVQVLTYLDELMKFDGQTRDVVGQSLGGFVFDSYM